MTCKTSQVHTDVTSNIDAPFKPLSKSVVTTIRIISIVIPVLVAILFRVRLDMEPLSFLPPIYAGINAVTALVLLGALWAIKKKRVGLHLNLIKCAMLLGAIFLLCYVAYHISSDPTVYGDLDHNGQLSAEELALVAPMKPLYYGILITHIVLSIAVVPLVLTTFAKGFQSDRTSHRRWAKVTFPIWLYVTITGVLVYVMIAPYYKA